MQISIGLGLRSTTALASSLSAYAVGSFDPALVFDFEQEYYRTGGSQTTFDSAMTHSRSGNATMVDSDGLLKWAPHNLLTYSEQFDNAAWAKTNATVTANVVTAPDGTLTADEVIPDTTSLAVTRVYNIAGTYTANIWVKDAGRGACAIAMGSNTIGYLINVDLTDGSYISGRSYGGGVLVGYTIADAGSGWYLVSVEATANVGGVSVFGGDGVSSASGIYIWGAHLYRSDLGGMVNNPDRGDSYVPTTSAARYLARRGHHVYNGAEWVNEGVLVESEARTNIVSDSSPAATFSPVRATLTSGQSPSPTGSSDASSFIEDTTASNTHIANYIVANPAAAGTYSISIFAKPRGRDYLYLQGVVDAASTNVTYGALFNVSTGSVVGVVGAAIISQALIEPHGDGFYRCTIVVPNPSGLRLDARIGIQASAILVIGGAGYTGDGVSGLTVFGYQVEASSTPSSYIPTSGSTVTRAADTLTVPSANLPWPTPNVIGPELVTNGTFDTDISGWSGNNATLSSVSGELVVTPTTTNQTAYSQVTLEVGKVYLISADLVDVNGSTSDKRLQVGTTITGSTMSQTIVSPTPQTIQAVFVATATTAYVNVYTFDGANAMVWDNISVREIDPLAVSIQMEGRMTYADSSFGTELQGFRWYVNASNNIETRLSTITTRTGEMQFSQVAGGVSDNVISGQTVYASGINVPFNIASRHGSTFINGAVDGTALTANTTPTALPDLSTTDLSLAYSGGPMIIKKVRIFADDLGDSGIAEASVTTPFISGVPTISGDTADPEVGETLTASSAPVVIGTPSPTTTWQWKRGGAVIAGATSTSYTLTDDDVGFTITVTQTETNSGGSDSATSAATATVQAVGATIVTDRAGNGIFDRAGSYIEVRA